MTKQKKSIKRSNIIICKHCHKKVTNPELVGITLVCSYCKKPVNGG
jgi:uncharacterized CHY-type Zn-finger protein